MNVEYVIKTSKLCNLRCRYCYEYPNLADRAAISLDQLARLYEHLAAYHGPRGDKLLFIWHGGEPLLQKPAWYHAAFDLQTQILGDLRWQNTMQTNLTLLDEGRLELLARLAGVGVSLDLPGTHRVDRRGAPSLQRVLANLDRVRAAQIPVGCITVLSRDTLPHIDQIFAFYRTTGLSCRLLPLFRAALPDAHGSDIAVSPSEVLKALCRVADLWLEQVPGIAIDPIHRVLRAILGRLSGAEFAPRYYDRREGERLCIVDTDGEVYSYAEAGMADRAWGNLFRQPLDELLSSATREASIERSERRMAAACLGCAWFGACNGYAIGECNDDHPEISLPGDLRSCVVRAGLYRHIALRLREAERALGPSFWVNLHNKATDAALPTALTTLE